MDQTWTGKQAGSWLPNAAAEWRPARGPHDFPFLTSLLRLNLCVQLPATSTSLHPALSSQCVLMNASIFLFSPTTVISEINTSGLWLLICGMLDSWQQVGGEKIGLDITTWGWVGTRGWILTQFQTSRGTAKHSPLLVSVSLLENYIVTLSMMV